MKSGIYIIENILNETKYVGSAINIKKRWYQHKYTLNNGTHDNSYLQRAWNKYGESSFRFRIIEITEPENLISREQHYINSYDTYKSGYNLTPNAGNTLGFKFTEESKSKMSKKKKGKPSTRKNYKHSDITKKRIGDSNRISQKGRQHSEETKEKMSEWHKNKTVSEETRKKLSDWRKGLRVSDKTGTKITNNQKNVLHEYNKKHRIKQPKIYKPNGNRGTNNGNSITDENEVISIRKDYDLGLKISELQSKYNKKYMFIYKIVNRLTWGWLNDSGFSD